MNDGCTGDYHVFACNGGWLFSGSVCMCGAKEYGQLLDRAVASGGVPRDIDAWAKRLADVGDLTD